jgi:hypothetical protein
VGKSSLINYLAGKPVAKTGAGKPVTPKGEFQEVTIPSPRKPDVHVTFYDSWGLEADQGEIWKRVMGEKLDATLALEKVISGIIYCASYANNRIQDFEIELAGDLLAKRYRVILALTKADMSNFAVAKDVYRRRFNEGLKDYAGDYTFVDIAAEAKPKIGQSAAGAAFGKDELFAAIEQDIHANFRTVILARFAEWKKGSLDEVRSLRHSILSVIDKFPGDFWKTNFSKAKEIHDEMAGKILHLQQEVFRRLSDDLKHAGSLHKHFTGAFFHSPILTDPFSLFDLVFYPLIVGKQELQGDLRAVLLRATEDFEDQINKAYEEAEKTLWEMK